MCHARIMKRGVILTGALVILGGIGALHTPTNVSALEAPTTQVSSQDVSQWQELLGALPPKLQTALQQLSDRFSQAEVPKIQSEAKNHSEPKDTTKPEPAKVAAQQPKKEEISNPTVAGNPGEGLPQANNLFVLGNGVRAKHNAAALSLHEKLTKSAQFKAEDMAKNNYFAHQGKNSSRMNGLDYLKELGAPCKSTSENIQKAWGTQATNQKVMDSWVNSPAHFRALINPKYKLTGLGVAKSSSGVYYSVQHFCEVK